MLRGWVTATPDLYVKERAAGGLSSDCHRVECRLMERRAASILSRATGFAVWI